VTFKHYQVQLSTSPAFDGVDLGGEVTTLTTPSFTPASDLTPNTTYYWRVRSFNSADQYSQWSVVRSFRTAVLPPALTAPTNSSTLTNTLPLFDWQDVSGATGYTLQISKSITFTSLVLNVSPTGTASQYQTTTALPGGIPLYWRVLTRATNGPSAWSDVGSVTSANPPSIPALNLPAAGALTTDYTSLSQPF
jgi:hypothetical protein